MTGSLRTVTTLVGTTEFEYFADGLVKSVHSADATTTFAYDAAGRLTKTTDPLGHDTLLAYGAASQVTSATDALGRSVHSTYDNSGHPLSVTAPSGRRVESTYDADGNRDTVKDAAGKTTRFIYDVMDKLTGVVDSNGATSTYTYDRNYKLASVTDARGKLTAYDYDAADRLTRTEDALGQVWDFTYDGAGNMTGTVFPDDTSVARTFTPHGLVETVRYSGDDTAYDFSYTPGNRLSSVTDQDGETYGLTYNPVGWLTSVTDSFDPGVSGGFATAFGYDTAGRVTSLRASGEASRTYGYDSRGDLTSLELPSDPGTHTTYTYDAARQLGSASLPDGSLTAFGYDTDGLLASIATTLPSGVLALTYGRNANGQVTSENAQRFGYDDVGRLSVWYDASADATTTYAYDAASNLTSVVRDGVPVRSFAFDDANRIASPGFTYDGRGNLTSDGQRIYAYDAGNRLTSVIDAETSATLGTYAYDAFNRRVRATEGATTTVFHYAGTSGNVITETDGAGTTLATYAYGAGGRLHSMTRGGATFYYHLSARGDVIALSDANGEVVNEYRYDPWGNSLGATETVANPYRYAGYRIDGPSGLYYCWNRHYAPQIGRFLQRDLVPGQLSRPASMNPYAYCENDPVNGVDPSGLMTGNSMMALGLGIAAVGLGALSIALLVGSFGTLTPLAAAGLAVAAGAFGAALGVAGMAITQKQYAEGEISPAEYQIQMTVGGVGTATSVGGAGCAAVGSAAVGVGAWLAVEGFNWTLTGVTLNAAQAARDAGRP